MLCEYRVLHRRPNGGATLWNKTLKATFKPIDYDSDLLLVCNTNDSYGSNLYEQGPPPGPRPALPPGQCMPH